MTMAAAGVAPCTPCPWRVSSRPGGADIPNFDMDKMRNLRCTVGHDDAFRPIMACHYSRDHDERPCVGYLARHGWSNLAVRMAVIGGRVDMDAVLDGCASLDLYADFWLMLEASEDALRGAS